MLYDLTHKLNEEEQTSEVDLNELGIIMIDMSQYFLDHISQEKKSELTSSHVELLELAKTKNIPVIQMNIKRYGSGKTIKKLDDLVKQVPRNHSFYKLEESVFSNPSVEAQLKEWNVNYLLLMGINTYCVKSTAEDARKKTYQVITAPELIATPANDHKAWKEHTTWFRNNIVYLDSYVQILNILHKK